MKIYFFIFFFLFGYFFLPSSFGSRPAKENILKNISEGRTNTRDSISVQRAELPLKPKKTGLGMIAGGIVLTILGIIFGIGLLLTFLLGFSIGTGFYFRDIYATAGVMLFGLVIFGLGIFLISRGREYFRAYQKYKKALRQMKKQQ